MKRSKTAKTYVMVHQDRDFLIPVLESYATVSKRLMEVGDFFEVTTTQGKETFAKRSVLRVAPNTNLTPAPRQEAPKEESPRPQDGSEATPNLNPSGKTEQL